MAVSPEALSQLRLGIIPSLGINNSTATLAMSAAATWYGCSYNAPASKTLAAVELYVHSITAVPLAADFQIELYSDTAAGIPNATVEARTADANPAAGYVRCSGFTTALTAGTRYWFLNKNLNALPATNFWTLRFAGAQGAFAPPMLHTGTTGTSSFTKIHSTDSGATWVSTFAWAGMMMLEFSDGSFDGIPIYALVQVSPVGVGIYGARELGNLITTPLNATLNIKGFGLGVAVESGSPTGNLRGRLYNDTTLLATSQEVYTPSQLTGSTFVEFTFATVQAVAGGSTLRFVFGETTQSDTSGNRFNATYWDIKNTADARGLLPFGGSMKQTYLDGTWTEDSTKLIPGYLRLDTDGEFAVATILHGIRVV
jgi:hypothetical protein